MGQNKMRPGPWKIRFMVKDDPESDFFIEAPKTNPIAGHNVEIMGSEDGPNYTYDQKKADAEAIASAVNNTYGIGINSESVKDMLDSLKSIVNCNECENGWISDACISQAKAAIEKAKLNQ